ncbi:hypothetical protein Vsou_02330 [Vulcanisaeta souniana JCM 11219]|uniref:Uncharacterized protein n=1 Tax=Vulcanisaeta souniana JCM 11219 TaxID=1293586 RepID=A0ABM8BJK9_9CREN|nr:hypothetical protein Vsou_02330 [Vulcanisaeta souniana JCM 11219]
MPMITFFSLNGKIMALETMVIIEQGVCCLLTLTQSDEFLFLVVKLLMDVFS